MARYVLALDQGTTSSRAILFDASGNAGRERAARVPPALPAARLGRARSRRHLEQPARDTSRVLAQREGHSPATSSPSASPISARPRCSGIAAPANLSAARSSGRTVAPPTCARN